MVRLALAKCPKCGADLKLDPREEVATCAFCGASSFVTTRNRPVTEEAIRAKYTVIQVQAPASRATLFVVGGAALAFGLVAFLSLRVWSSTALAPRPASNPALEPVAPAGAVLIPQERGQPSKAGDELAPAAKDAPFRGPADAPVVVEMFADLQCPFTKRAQPIMDELLAKYPAKVRLVWRHQPLPFHPKALAAAEAALEAKAQLGNDGFWRMTALLFENQSALDSALFEKSARDLGMNVGAFRAALRDGRHRAVIEADRAAAVRAGVSGTPSFFVNGERLTGAQPLEKFTSLVEQALSQPTGAAKP